MNTFSLVNKRIGSLAGPTLILTTVLLAACASAPTAPSGAQEVRVKLTEMQNDPDMANNARVELRAADAAVRVAEEPLARNDRELGEHRVYMADKRVEMARESANTRMAQTELTRLERELQAERQAAQRLAANRSRENMAASEASQLSRQQQIDALGAQATDRGLKLGDVMFEFGSADLSGDGARNLDRLVTFLNLNEGRDVLIEGHTDSVGSAAFNQGLSERRAESVRGYLSDHGIQRNKLAASGFGLAQPVANNNSDNGRQQNRRVEVIIANE